MYLKVRLLVGAALPLVCALPAVAQVSIETATTTPVSTATANNGAPSDITITSAGSITLTQQNGATAVTINSSNKVANAGIISTVNSDNSVGVRIIPGLTAGYSGAGTISLLEDYERTDADGDGDLDGPLAQGTGRIGLLIESGGVFTGDIDAETGGSIGVEGNDSFGVSIRSTLQGSYRQKNTVTVTGSNSIAIDLRENVTGDVIIAGAILATGENSIAMQSLGDVGGEFRIDGSLQASGFTSLTTSNYADPDELGSDDTPIAERRDADDLLVGGPALAIRGDLARGLLLQGLAVGTADPTEDVKDVVQNFNDNRTTASIVSYGSAPGLLIQPLDGAAGRDLVLGKVRESVADTLDDDDDDDLSEIIGVFDYDYGLINRGQITANGFNIGFASNAVRLAGSADGTHSTMIEGGVFNGGAVVAAAFEADAVGFSFGSGVTTPQFINTSSITAAIATETNHDAYAVRIDVGANVPTVSNSGSMTANVRGYDGDAIAFQDLSGTVTSFTNTSRIVAGYTDNDAEDSITSGNGQAIALDLSHSTSDVKLTQNDPIDNTRIFGDVRFGVGNDRFDLLSGEVAGDVDFGGGGSDTFLINSAKFTGDAIFRGAGASFSMVGGTMEGALALNNTTGSLSFSGGALYNGAISRAAGAAGPMTLSVNNATVNNNAAGTLQISALSLQNQAKFGFVIDNARIAANTPIFNIAGAADIGANTVFTPIFEQFSDQPFTLRVLTAGTLNLGGPVAQMLNANSPFLYNVSLTRPAGTNALDLGVRVKTAAELGLNDRSASAYDGVLDLLEGSDTVAAAMTSIATGPEFLRAWGDILPGQDASIIRVLASNATAAFGATAHRLDLVMDKPDAPGGAWVEEFGVFHDSDSDTASLGVSGGGFGVAAGLDLIASRNAIFGGFLALESIEMEERGRTAAPLNMAQTSIGGYAGWRLGGLALNGNASYGWSTFTSDREVTVGPLTDRLRAEWKGSGYTAAGRATYGLPLGFLKVTPYAGVDYISISEDPYRETATTNTDLELIAGSGEASLASASYGVAFSADFGQGGQFDIQPELSVGYRSILSWDNPSTLYRFGGSGTAPGFVLNSGKEPEDAIVAGFGLNINGQYVNMKVGYDAEISEGAFTHYGSVTLRMAFW